jgi:hypothetical protein
MRCEISYLQEGDYEEIDWIALTALMVLFALATTVGAVSEVDVRG